ncbi:MAG: 3-keto-5-aminohexanoate cleavage enzyme [Actinoplanes sp.]|nr:3-keto-5-aminohexanoate cleavage enzyme [Actinoplanes sp.]
MTTGTLITVVPTGGQSRKAAVPALPVDLADLIVTAQECEALGASVITVHARDEAGEPSLSLDLLRPIVRELGAATDLIVQLATTTTTTGAGGEPAADQLWVLDAGPEMASCPLGSPIHPALHDRMRDAGIVAGYEVTERGQLATLARLLDERGLPAGGRVHVTLLMGGPTLPTGGPTLPTGGPTPLAGGPTPLAGGPALLAGGAGMPGTAAELVACQAMIADLPPGTSFSAAGAGTATLPVMLAALSTGGHLRVGMADTTTWSQRQPVDSNMQLVARAVSFAQLAQRPPLTTKEAREVLGVPAR